VLDDNLTQVDIAGMKTNIHNKTTLYRHNEPTLKHMYFEKFLTFINVIFPVNVGVHPWYHQNNFVRKNF